MDIYGLPGEDANDEPVFAFPSGTMVVVGNLDDVKAGLENLKAGKTVALPDALAALVKGARADAAVTVACVVTPELLAAMPGGLAQAGGEKFGSFVLAVAIDKDLGVDAKVAMRDEAAATESRNEMLEGLAGAAANPMFANPAMKPLKDLLGAVKIGGKGSDVTISVTVSSDTIVQAAMMGQMMAQMMMSGGAGMGPGMGPGFGPDMGPGGDMSGDTEAEDVWIEDEDTGDEDTGDEDTDDAEEDWFDKE